MTPFVASKFTGISGRRLFSDAEADPGTSQLMGFIPVTASMPIAGSGSMVNTAVPGFLPLLIVTTSTLTEGQAEKPRKYSPPDFVTTIKFMRSNLFEVAGSSEKSHEPSELKNFYPLWKSELLKETWFTSENVSIFPFFCHLGIIMFSSLAFSLSCFV